ncbi:MAG: NAD(P)H-dependent glycerol-3-phosphate dehydrogenase [Tenericutes bacterium]|nr:NAD(P)H-dependent glycerol-3-phosphate dehydrogenase [Mycoplasmatota bacterium]
MNITILGAGAYALGLALRFNKNKNKIIIWSAVKSEIDTLTKTRMNEKALKGVKMPNNFIYTENIEKALDGSDIVVIAVATKFLSSVCDTIKPYVKDKHIIIASKGIEQETYNFASNIIKGKLKTKKLATISGPSFAKDMATDSLIGLSLATTNNKTKEMVIKALSSDTLKIRPTKDFLGVELCGTMKNVIAVAAGMLDGMKANESTKAMFLTESINDTRKLIKKLGGNEKTIMSYAGFGDILLTCTSTSSRNYSYGKLIGSNAPKDELDEYLSNNTVEGVYTLESIYGLIKSKKVKMPFIDFVYDVVFNYRSSSEILTFLNEKE